MKPQTVHSLLIARTLHDEAKRLITSEDRHMCSAGLILLQDVLEIVMLALLNEKGVDGLEFKKFDELVGELKNAGISVPKTGSLRALNKQRVTTKHYGEPADPVGVQGYEKTVQTVLDSIVPQVLDKKLSEVFLTEILIPGEAREFLTEAAKLIEQGSFFPALTEIRKAIYVKIEHQYSIHGWIDVPEDELNSPWAWFDRGGRERGGDKAPESRRNPAWIQHNVRDPLDYVQRDYERLRLDGMKWGVNIAELENLLHLTPEVFRREKGSDWHVRYVPGLLENEATAQNARYCLDRAISILLRRQQFFETRRRPSDTAAGEAWRGIGQNVFEKATQESRVIHIVRDDYTYLTQKIVSGFNPQERYRKIYVYGMKVDGELEFAVGFVLLEDDTIIGLVS